MEVRGIRQCKSCGSQWSYYETGSPACPECGSMYSVGIDERTLHTDRPAEMDLTAALEALSENRYREAGEAADETARKYVHQRGFINAGDLRPLADRYLVAHEIRYVAQQLRGTLSTGIGGDDIDVEYVRMLFEAAQKGDRPAPSMVPDIMADSRGLAVADAVDDYREALRNWIKARDPEIDVDGPLARLDDHVRRIRALDGTIQPETAENLVRAARTIGRHVQPGSEVESLDESLDDLL